MKRITLLNFLVGVAMLCVFGACQNDPPPPKSDLLKIQLSPTSKGKTLFSDLVEAYEFVPLETTEASTVGRAQKLRISGDRVFFFDMLSGNKLVVFSREGQFLYAIDTKGKGPGEYEFLLDFTVDEKNNRLYLLDNGRSIVVYDLDGNFIEERLTGIYSGNFVEKIPGGFAFIGGNKFDNLILSSGDLREQNAFFPYQERSIELMILNPIQPIENGQVIYRRHLYDTIFAIKDFSITPHAVLDFGEYTITYPELLEADVTDINGYVEDYCTVFHYLEAEGHVLVRFSYKNEAFYGLVDKRTQHVLTFSYEDFVNDLTFEKRSVFVGTDPETGAFLYLVQPYVLKDALASDEIDEAERKSTAYQRVEAMADTLTDLSNPVLMMVHFKGF